MSKPDELSAAGLLAAARTSEPVVVALVVASLGRIVIALAIAARQESPVQRATAVHLHHSVGEGGGLTLFVHSDVVRAEVGHRVIVANQLGLRPADDVLAGADLAVHVLVEAEHGRGIVLGRVAAELLDRVHQLLLGVPAARLGHAQVLRYHVRLPAQARARQPVDIRLLIGGLAAEPHAHPVIVVILRHLRRRVQQLLVVLAAIMADLEKVPHCRVQDDFEILEDLVVQ